MLKFPEISKEYVNIKRKSSYKYDAIVVLGAVMKWNTKKTLFLFTSHEIIIS